MNQIFSNSYSKISYLPVYTTLCFWICNRVLIKLKGYKAHLTVNELNIDNGKNLLLSIMSHSIFLINWGGGDSTIVDIIWGRWISKKLWLASDFLLNYGFPSYIVAPVRNFRSRYEHHSTLCCDPLTTEFLFFFLRHVLSRDSKDFKNRIWTLTCIWH